MNSKTNGIQRAHDRRLSPERPLTYSLAKTPHCTSWRAVVGDRTVLVFADRWYDAREQARVSLGLPTYDGLKLRRAEP